MTISRTDKITSPFEPIRLERVADKVSEQIKNLIKEGLLKAGDRLPSERELAIQMHVSRPSVREALQKLDAQGIVEIIHGGGSRVRNLTEHEIRKPIAILLDDERRRVVDLTEVRAFMEAWAARKAAENRTEEELERMRCCLEEMEQDLEKGRIRYEVDFQFHTEVAAASHNTIFLHVISSIYELINYSVKLHREKIFVAAESQRKIFAHHLQVFKAIQDRDPDTAETAMKEHLVFVIQEFKKWSAERE